MCNICDTSSIVLFADQWNMVVVSRFRFSDAASIERNRRCSVCKCRAVLMNRMVDNRIRISHPRPRTNLEPHASIGVESIHTRAVSFYLFSLFFCPSFSLSLPPPPLSLSLSLSHAHSLVANQIKRNLNIVWNSIEMLRDGPPLLSTDVIE